MRWDSSRPVPWQRLVREWLIYVGIMTVVLVVFFRDSGAAGAIAGVLVSGPLYLLFGFVMAKLGYQRRSLKEMGTPRATHSDDADTTGDSRSGGAKGRPAPTRRTSGGGNRPKSKPRRR
jgi:hypothetical protein